MAALEEVVDHLEEVQELMQTMPQQDHQALWVKMLQDTPAKVAVVEPVAVVTMAEKVDQEPQVMLEDMAELEDLV